MNDHHAPARVTARVVPVNPAGQCLLLLGTDPIDECPPYWFTVGGGVEAGETLHEAAVREALEEIGLAVDREALIGPAHVGRWQGPRLLVESHFFALALDEVEVSFSGQQPDEDGFIVDWGWLTPEALATDGRFVNRALPEILAKVVTAAGRSQ
ncbi:NUDIX hydrolase [Nocardioides sp. LHG3406-4]|uniref:NUDIX hydrolase n=1 Tax=Nocardioides sp. LHG3406-4 TaxID=2804575 RepID=UPI003CEAB826